MIFKYALREGFTIGADISLQEINGDADVLEESFRRPVEVFPIMANGSRGRMAYKTLFRDENYGKLYFTWNSQRVYIDNYLRIDYETIKNKLKYREYVDEADIVCLIIMTGIDKIRIRDSVRKSRRQIIKVGVELLIQTPEEEIVDYKIVEDRYKLNDRFKIELKSTADSGESYIYEFSSFIEALKNNYIEIVIEG